MTRTDYELTDAFAVVGEPLGFTDIDAKFAPYRDFKVISKRKGMHAEFSVTDHLSEAPVPVMESLASILLHRMAKVSDRDADEHDAILREYVESKEYLEARQPVYMRRSRNLSGSTVGAFRDLNESYERVIDTGLVDGDRRVLLSWTTNPNYSRIGYCSVMMKVIGISSALDRNDVPEFVLDFVVYHELLHTLQSPILFSRHHDRTFRQVESMYPRSDEAEIWLRKLRNI